MVKLLYTFRKKNHVGQKFIKQIIEKFYYRFADENTVMDYEFQFKIVILLEVSLVRINAKSFVIIVVT